MKQDFGKIYGSNPTPTFGVYAQHSLDQWGERAVAISHHWSREAAETAAKKETAVSGYTCVAVEYEVAK